MAEQETTTERATELNTLVFNLEADVQSVDNHAQVLYAMAASANTVQPQGRV